MSTKRENTVQSEAPKPRRGLGSRIRRGLVWLIAGLVALAVIGAIYQAAVTAIDQRQSYPPPGQMVSVGGHRMHINCTGKGNPTVVLESGWSFTSIEWSAYVQPEVAKQTRVCAYDRAGLAWSEAGATSRDAAETADELHALLHNAGIEGPYILVGHSLGGVYSRVYADRYPEDVGGMVLVQAMHPDQFERPGMRSTVRMNQLGGIIGPPLARIGLVRLLDMFPPSPEMPALQRKQADPLYYQTPHLVAELKELGAMDDVMDQVRKTEGLGDKPLAVVSAADERESRALQQELAHLSSDSTQRVVEGSTDDSLVLNRSYAQRTSEEIVRVVEAVRTDQPLTR